jgi:UDP-2,4-diacetamido-2,4,6-trideoxy-beta-L-altropyranose hydrolase
VDHPVVLIRADASPAIGLGHVARCRSLACALRAAGARVLFACRDDEGIAARFLAPARFRVVALPDLPEVEDARRSLAAAGRRPPAAIVADHYGLGPAWWREARRATPLLVIDDVGRKDLDGEADLVLNQNAGAGPGMVPRTMRALLGPRFAMLRPEYLSLRAARARRRAPKQASRLFVTVGGADPHGVTGRLVRGLRGVPALERIDVVVGPASGRVPIVDDPRVRLVRSPPDFPELLAAADIALTGGGTTVYESACLGLPALAVRMAANQNGICTAMAAAGPLLDLGPHARLSARRAARAVADLAADPGRRAAMARAGRRLVDGLGAGRVARALLDLAEGRPA